MSSLQQIWAFDIGVLSSLQSLLSGSSFSTPPPARSAPNPPHQAYLAEPTSIASPPRSSHSQALVATPSTVYDPLWYPDSRASNHLTLNLANLSVRHPHDDSDWVQVGNGLGLSILHTGHSNLYSHSFNKSFVLRNLLHVPGLTKILISVSQFAKQNRVFFEFHANACYVKCQDSKEILLRGFTRDGLYAFPNL